MTDPRPLAPVPDPSDVDGVKAMAPVAWDGLPDALRARLAELTAEAVGRMPALDVPAPLRRLARFAPAKRARLGAGPLVATLSEDADFRAAVADWWRERDETVLAPDAADPVTAAAAALLVDDAGAAYRVREVAERSDARRWRLERDAALARVNALTGELQRLRAELAAVRAALHGSDAAHAAELTTVRARLREAVARARDAEQAARSAAEEIGRERDEVRGALAQAVADRDRERAQAAAERARADRANAEVSAARQSAREARAADEVRLQLLVDTMAGALAGLRRELALGAGGAHPADLVGGVRAPDGTPPVTDAAALDRLLALPAVHLVVDGYNVTKTGYPELTLAAQRERLAGQLAALAARTGAETTVIFDGADIVNVPSSGVRGVRVLFSAPGVPADDVIRGLVAAEPRGRPVVVATSDRAIVESVRRRGVHPVSSAVLLTRLTR